MQSEYFETKCFLIDRKLSETFESDENVPETEARVAVNLNEVESYREVMLKDDISEKRIMLNFKSSESLMIDCSYDEFSKVMKDYVKTKTQI